MESCRRNPSIDWLFFTDCGIPDDAPENLRFIETDFPSYCQLVSRRLDIDFRPDSPYKLCDLKPALGFLHAEHLAGYDFWAFGDIDVIYGDLRRYFSDKRLARKDIFSTHQRRVSGHLCLLRNNRRMREAFKRIPRWRERFVEEHQALDEGAFSRLFIRHKNWPEPLRMFAARFYPSSRRGEFIEAHSTYILQTDGSKYMAERWFWRDGRLTNSEQGALELPYLHFMTWKNGPWRGVCAERLLGSPGLHKALSWQVGAEGWRLCVDTISDTSYDVH